MATLFILLNAHAKRLSPKNVAPVTVEGVEYRAPHRKMGVVEAWKDGKMIWEQQIYSVKINDKLEEDVQWIFIKKMEHKEKFLFIENERKMTFALDLKTKKVIQIGAPFPKDTKNTPWGNKMENGLQVRIREFPGLKNQKENFSIIFEVRNTSDNAVKFCRWLSPLDGLAHSDRFDVIGPDGKLPFAGRYVSRIAAGEKDFITLKPGGTISVKYNLNWEYPALKAGTLYTLEFTGSSMGPLSSSNKIELKVTE